MSKDGKTNIINIQVQHDISRALAAYYTEVDKIEDEVGGLRELMFELRSQLIQACVCDEVRVDRNSEVCGSCILVGMIDDGLAKIAKDRDDG